MLRFSLNQVQAYAHTANLYIAKWNPTGTSYRFRVFDENKEYLDDDWLFETTSLAEVVAFVRGYRKALAKVLRDTASAEEGNGKKEETSSHKAPPKAANKGRSRSAHA